MTVSSTASPFMTVIMTALMTELSSGAMPLCSASTFLVPAGLSLRRGGTMEVEVVGGGRHVRVR